MELVNRIADLDDIKALSRLVNSAYRGESSKKGWTTEADILDGQRTDPITLMEMISHPSKVVLLFYTNEELVGCVSLQNKTSSAYLGMLTVKPDLQALGIGKNILSTAEEWVLTNWQLPTIEMTVIQKRLELIAWYEKRGYQKTGERLPFPYGDERFGLPKVNDLEFIVLKKQCF